jgi:para-aminobenzoate synthetase/4-amino-4-deoxychorismate lyase
LLDHNPVVEAAVQLAGGEWLLLSDPVRILEAHIPEAVAPTLEAVEHAARAHGLHAAGFLSYEAGTAFGLPAHEASRDVPLAWFALFEDAATRRIRQIPSGDGYALGTFEPSVDRAAFDCGFRRIKDRIAAGDTYQVNYTFRLDGPFRGDPRSLFADLVAAQGSRHSTYISAGELAVCSASPELFFERAPGRTPAEPFLLTTRPMKGTVRRGRTLGEDATRCEGLQASA